MSNPYPHLCPYESAVEGGLPCQCEPVTPENTRNSESMVIERICLKCHKPIKKTKRKVKTVCNCSDIRRQNNGESNI